MTNLTPLHTIEQRVRIAASPATVWSFWTDPRLVVEWWGSRAEVVPELGGIFRIEMGDDGPIMRGQYLELEPHTRLVFAFGWEHQPMANTVPPGSTRVEVTLTPDGDDTELLLTHSMLPAAQAEEHLKGWAHFVGERLVEAAQAHPGGIGA